MTYTRHNAASHGGVCGGTQPESGSFPPASQPSVRELFLLVVVSAAIFLLTCSLLHDWRSLAFSYGDNGVYLAVANAISNWNFQNVGIQHFMGYPYFIAAVSILLHISLPTALWLIAAVASLFSTYVVAQLFGTWVAAYFALTNFAWLQVSFLGGSEPLALALGLGALWMFRRDNWVMPSVLASIAVTVRPLMIFALVAMGLTLLYQRKYLQFFSMLGISIVVGALYVLPLALYFGDPLLTIHSYTTRDYGAGQIKGPHGHLFGWPFHGIIVGTFVYPGPWTNMLLSFVWILLVLAGVFMMFSADFRQYATAHVAEVIFCGLYLLSVFSYDYLVWARSAFIRFSIPALPFIFLALLRYLPKRRYVLWLVACACSILAAFSAVGLRNVLSFL